MRAPGRHPGVELRHVHVAVRPQRFSPGNQGAVALKAAAAHGRGGPQHGRWLVGGELHLDPLVPAELRGRSALRRVLHEAPRKEGVERRGAVGRYGRRLVVHDPVERGDLREVKVGRRASEQLHNAAAQGPDVRGRGELGALDGLRGHPECRAHGQVVLLLALRSEAGHTKVREFDPPIAGDQQVAALHVAVHHAVGVQVL
mmetsp:Transcript_19313/g.64743  ORF Transcript_19313/g.64743 Transcript_19313/m.64743 type:complete len:201 (+) Transcript_19313:1077-1679(+)